MKASKVHKPDRVFVTPVAPITVAALSAAMLSVAVLSIAAKTVKAAHFAQAARADRATLSVLVPPAEPAQIGGGGGTAIDEIKAAALNAAAKKKAEEDAKNKPADWENHIGTGYPCSKVQDLATMPNSLVFRWVIEDGKELNDQAISALGTDGKPKKVTLHPVSVRYQILGGSPPVVPQQVGKIDKGQDVPGIGLPTNKPAEIISTGIASTMVEKSATLGTFGTFVLDNRAWKNVDWSRLKVVEEDGLFGKDTCCVVYVRGILLQENKEVATLPNAVKVSVYFNHKG